MDSVQGRPAAVLRITDVRSQQSRPAQWLLNGSQREFALGAWLTGNAAVPTSVTLSGGIPTHCNGDLRRQRASPVGGSC